MAQKKLFTKLLTCSRVSKNQTHTQMRDIRTNAVSLCADVLKKILDPGLLDKEVLRISEVLSALNENAKSVEVKRRLLSQPWPGALDFISSLAKGYILVLFSPVDANSRDNVKSTLTRCGIPAGMIKLEVVTPEKDVHEYMEDRNCRVIIYKSNLSNDLIKNLKGEFSAVTKSFLEVDIKRALAELKVRHEQ